MFLEDLGFQQRKPESDVESMTYYFYDKVYYNKIFADINYRWVLEMCLVPEELHIDRWRLEGGIYIVKDDIEVDLCHPQSMCVATEFIKESLKIAKR